MSLSVLPVGEGALTLWPLEFDAPSTLESLNKRVALMYKVDAAQISGFSDTDGATIKSDKDYAAFLSKDAKHEDDMRASLWLTCTIAQPLKSAKRWEMWVSRFLHPCRWSTDFTARMNDTYIQFRDVKCDFLPSEIGLSTHAPSKLWELCNSPDEKELAHFKEEEDKWRALALLAAVQCDESWFAVPLLLDTRTKETLRRAAAMGAQWCSVEWFGSQEKMMNSLNSIWAITVVAARPQFCPMDAASLNLVFANLNRT